MAQATSTAAPGEMVVRSEPLAERRSAPRSDDVHVRRRLGQVANLHTERRRAKSAGFDVAAVLELNLSRYPTKTGMLTLLRSWLYAAERDGLHDARPDYAVALWQAVQVMEQAAEPVQAIALLHARRRRALVAA